MLTHQKLIQRAEVWLRKNRRCTVVLTEAGGVDKEIPDAIGWRSNGDSWLIECKTSRSDFRADRHKFFERSGERLGTFRFYLAEPSLIKPEELPPGWGLLEAHPTQVRKRRAAKRQPKDSGGFNLRVRNERDILLCELRKFQHRENGWFLTPGRATERVLKQLGERDGYRVES